MGILHVYVCVPLCVPVCEYWLLGVDGSGLQHWRLILKGFRQEDKGWLLDGVHACECAYMRT